MTNPSRGRQKKKFTITASEEGVEIAEKALLRLGFESKSNFAKSQLISPGVVYKFFKRQPIQLDTLKRICDALKLNWREVAGLEEEQQKQVKRKNCSSLEAQEEVGSVQTLHRLVTVIDQQNGTAKAEITLKGDINSVDNLKMLELILRQHSGHTIKIKDIQEGSIKLNIEGSEEDINRLLERIKSGELTEVNGFPIEDISILSESSEFLKVFRQEFLASLDAALAQVINQRLNLSKQRGSDQSEQFLRAICLFHCQGKSMGEIAKELGLKAQYKVTRLLKLKEFRADVRQTLLIELRDRIRELAKIYTDSQQLQTFDQQIDQALDEQISQIIQEAESESHIAHNRPTTSLFSKRLCRYIDTLFQSRSQS